MTNRPEPTIVVGVDGSPGSIRAIRYAAAEAARTGSRIRLVHAVPDHLPVTPMLPLLPQDLLDIGSTVLAEARTAAVARAGAERVEADLVRGGAVPALVAASEGAHLVVLGHERRSLVDRLVTGVTVTGVAARAHCPVLVVPDGADGRLRNVVVVGVERPTRCREILRHAYDAADRRHAFLRVVHSWEVPSPYQDLVEGRTARERWAEQVRSEITPVMDECRRDWPDVAADLEVVHGQAAGTLLRMSREADLLVLERPHHRMPPHLGSISRALLQKAGCPVEVVPSGVGLPEPEPLAQRAEGRVVAPAGANGNGSDQGSPVDA